MAGAGLLAGFSKILNLMPSLESEMRVILIFESAEQLLSHAPLMSNSSEFNQHSLHILS